MGKVAVLEASNHSPPPGRRRRHPHNAAGKPFWTLTRRFRIMVCSSSWWGRARTPRSSEPLGANRRGRNVLLSPMCLLEGKNPDLFLVRPTIFGTTLARRLLCRLSAVGAGDRGAGCGPRPAPAPPGPARFASPSVRIRSRRAQKTKVLLEAAHFCGMTSYIDPFEVSAEVVLDATCAVAYATPAVAY